MMKMANLNLTNASVIAVRDFLNLSIKFKPWQAVKIAKFINNGVPIIGSIAGIAFELWDSYSKKQKEDEFLRTKNKIKEDFDKKIFRSYFKLQNNIVDLSNELSEKEKEKEIFKNWMEKAKVIDDNLKAIKVNEE